MPTQISRQPKPISPCQEIINTALAWVNRQIQRHPYLTRRSCDDWDVDKSLFFPALEARRALEVACIAGDEEQTKIAARAFCTAWREIVNAAKKHDAEWHEEEKS